MNAEFEDSTTSPTRQSPGEWRRALRADMRARRMALSAEDCRLLSARIVAYLTTDLPPRVGSVVGFCWPIQNEPDVRPALAYWRDLGVRGVLPVVTAPDSPLKFRAWTPETPMMDDVHGIPTPSSGEWLTPDILILPLNAFDAAGYRLGYGGGYFDRTLASLRPRPLSVGVGYEINRVASIRPQPHDQPLDWVVTEQGVFRGTALAASGAIRSR